MLARASGISTCRTSDSIPFVCQSTWVRPRVLVVEFRDEVHAGLKTLVEEHGFEVERAERGADGGSRIQPLPAEPAPGQRRHARRE